MSHLPTPIKRSRYTKPCPTPGCPNRCDRAAKQCAVCFRGRFYGLWIPRVPTTPPPAPKPIPRTVVAAQPPTDLDGCCSRWRCLTCNQHWLGEAAEHVCASRRAA